MSNVEFYHTGQEGWTDAFDPRFSIVFLDTGVSTPVRPSFLRNSAFHHGFAPAIGTFGVENLTISNNVVYHTVGSCKLNICTFPFLIPSANFLQICFDSNRKYISSFMGFFYSSYTLYTCYGHQILKKKCTA